MVAAAHVTQCPYCIRSHTQRARQKGATGQEIMGAVWGATEMESAPLMLTLLSPLFRQNHPNPLTLDPTHQRPGLYSLEAVPDAERSNWEE
ncbi:MAG: carboxymuconolactone decarboxylase family protein [Acidobacteriales bacterium]|nr:carboxymuconolactone decarboxylase family protein [Terriglobales bacterium]